MSFGRRQIEEHRLRRIKQRASNMAVLATVQGRAATYGGSTTGPAPKPDVYRDPVLLELAKGKPCLLLVPGTCNHRTDTTVACHSNFGQHGKGGCRRADDVWTVWGCSACHIPWLDQGNKASHAQKEAAFMAAHARQVLAWRVIAADPAEPARYRRAAQRALDHLNATPLTLEPSP